jgi:hypothetical protein
MMNTIVVRRAFDSLSHDILLEKLYNYGIRGLGVNCEIDISSLVYGKLTQTFIITASEYRRDQFKVPDLLFILGLALFVMLYRRLK